MSVYRFGPFEVRTRVRELYRSGTKVHLRGQPFQLLETLLQRPGEVVTREEMRDQLWPSDTFVDFEHGINASLRKLRQALGDSAAKPLYIETIPGVGYRFIAPLETVLEDPAVKSGETAAAEPPADDDAAAPTGESGHFASRLSSGGGRWFLVGLVAGIVMFGLILFAANSSRPVVHGAEGKPPDGPSISVSDAQQHGGEAESIGSSALHRHPSVTEALSPVRGKVWVVSVAQASHVTFPPPQAVPDATFTTRGIAYIGISPDNCYTLASFLAECGNRGFELKFSGLPNPNLGGAPAGPATAMSGRTWGILIEFTGTANLAKGQDISILHDDGVALEIDGQRMPGFDPLPTAPVLESVTFTGLSGVHSFDLLYANADGGGAWVLFYPALF